jgi:hypothetical protein
MPQNIEPFFQRYADAYSRYQLPPLLELVSLPCLLLADESKIMFSEPESLRQYFEQQFEQYRQVGVARADFRLQSQVRLSESLRFVSLYWYFYGNGDQVLFTCHTSYTLQSQQGIWQLVALLTDDEQAAYQRVRSAQA